MTIAADTDVTVTADNTADWAPTYNLLARTHSFAVYTSAPAEGGDLIGETEICAAPCVDTVSLNLAAGDYFFRCEVHPIQMTGTLIAQ